MGDGDKASPRAAGGATASSLAPSRGEQGRKSKPPASPTSQRPVSNLSFPRDVYTLLYACLPRNVSQLNADYVRENSSKLTAANLLRRLGYLRVDAASGNFVLLGGTSSTGFSSSSCGTSSTAVASTKASFSPRLNLDLAFAAFLILNPALHPCLHVFLTCGEPGANFQLSERQRWSCAVCLLGKFFTMLWDVADRGTKGKDTRTSPGGKIIPTSTASAAAPSSSSAAPASALHPSSASTFRAKLKAHPFANIGNDVVARVAVACSLVFAELEIGIADSSPPFTCHGNFHTWSSAVRGVSSPRDQSPKNHHFSFSAFGEGVVSGFRSAVADLGRGANLLAPDDVNSELFVNAADAIDADPCARHGFNYQQRKSKCENTNSNTSLLTDFDPASVDLLLADLFEKNLHPPFHLENSAKLEVRRNTNFRYMADGRSINPVERFEYFVSGIEQKFFPEVYLKLSACQLKYVVATWCAPEEFAWAREHVPRNFHNDRASSGGNFNVAAWLFAPASRQQTAARSVASSHDQRTCSSELSEAEKKMYASFQHHPIYPGSADPFSCDDWVGAATYKMCNYTDTNRNGVNIHSSWAAFYHSQPVTLKNMCDTGGVCGTVSRVGVGLAQSFGVPAVCVAQPGHCAFLVLKEEVVDGTTTSAGDLGENEKRVDLFWKLQNGNSARKESTRHDDAHLPWREGIAAPGTLIALLPPEKTPALVKKSEFRDDVAPWRMEMMDQCHSSFSSSYHKSTTSASGYMESENFRLAALLLLQGSLFVGKGDAASSAAASSLALSKECLSVSGGGPLSKVALGPRPWLLAAKLKDGSNSKVTTASAVHPVLDDAANLIVASVTACSYNYYAWLLFGEFFNRIARKTSFTPHWIQKVYEQNYLGGLDIGAGGAAGSASPSQSLSSSTSHIAPASSTHINPAPASSSSSSGRRTSSTLVELVTSDELASQPKQLRISAANVAKIKGKASNLFDGTDSEWMCPQESATLIYSFKSPIVLSEFKIKWWGLSRPRKWHVSIFLAESGKTITAPALEDEDSDNWILIASDETTELLQPTGTCNEWSVLPESGREDFQSAMAALPFVGLKLDMSGGQPDPWNLGMKLGIRRIDLFARLIQRRKLARTEMPTWFCGEMFRRMLEENCRGNTSGDGVLVGRAPPPPAPLTQLQTARKEDISLFKTRVMEELLGGGTV